MALVEMEERFMGFVGKRVLTATPIVLLALLVAGGASAWNHSELDWKTIDTEHFSIHVLLDHVP